MKRTTKWCVNCGKDHVRCKCKEPVINCEEGAIVSDLPEQMVQTRPFTSLFTFGAGVRG
jgi:hypothetical protein